MWNGNDIKNLIDPLIFDPCIEVGVMRYVHVGLLCVQEYTKDRPNVSTVLSMLNSEIAELPRPNLPAYVGRLGASARCSQESIDSLNGVSLTSVQVR